MCPTHQADRIACTPVRREGSQAPQQVCSACCCRVHAQHRLCAVCRWAHRLLRGCWAPVAALGCLQLKVIWQGQGLCGAHSLLQLGRQHLVQLLC